MEKIKVTNKKTGVVTEMSQKDVDAIQKNSLIANKYTFESVVIPKEVKAMEDKKKVTESGSDAGMKKNEK